MFKKILLSAIFAGFAMASININTATKEELMSLKGIGEAKAEAIIQYRKNNKFKSIEDLKNVPGIGEKNFDKFKSELSTSGATTISQNEKDKTKEKINKEKQKAKKDIEKAKQNISKSADASKEKIEKKLDKKKDDTKTDMDKKAKENKKELKDKLNQKLDKAITK